MPGRTYDEPEVLSADAVTPHVPIETEIGELVLTWDNTLLCLFLCGEGEFDHVLVQRDETGYDALMAPVDLMNELVRRGFTRLIKARLDEDAINALASIPVIDETSELFDAEPPNSI